jgi:putative endonuclease
MERGGYVYIMTNKNNTALYTGVTANLSKRILEHKERLHPESFTDKYNIFKLVYYEGFDHIEDAIAREKQIKAGSRQDKLDLINCMNPTWMDLYVTIYDI